MSDGDDDKDDSVGYGDDSDSVGDGDDDKDNSVVKGDNEKDDSVGDGDDSDRKEEGQGLCSSPHEASP